MKELDERLDNEEAVDSPSSPETLSVWGLAWPSILNNILFPAARKKEKKT